MTRQAPRTVKLDRFTRLFVGIVASAAPEPTFRVSRTCTESKLLHVADDLERAWRGARRNSVVIHSESILESLPSNEVVEALAGIWNACDTEEMTLLADAVATRGLELRGIHDRPRARIG
jgi:hypothetical protein